MEGLAGEGVACVVDVVFDEFLDGGCVWGVWGKVE